GVAVQAVTAPVSFSRSEPGSMENARLQHISAMYRMPKSMQVPHKAWNYGRFPAVQQVFALRDLDRSIDHGASSPDRGEKTCPYSRRPATLSTRPWSRWSW